jgi:hypothetical protein
MWYARLRRSLENFFPHPIRKYEIRTDKLERHEKNLTATDAIVCSTDHASDVIHSNVLDII